MVNFSSVCFVTSIQRIQCIAAEDKPSNFYKFHKSFFLQVHVLSSRQFKLEKSLREDF